jgi:hypothetical protein
VIDLKPRWRVAVGPAGTPTALTPWCGVCTSIGRALLHRLDPREPRTRELALEAYLSGLQEELVAALAGAPARN